MTPTGHIEGQRKKVNYLPNKLVVNVKTKKRNGKELYSLGGVTGYRIFFLFEFRKRVA